MKLVYLLLIFYTTLNAVLANIVEGIIDGDLSKPGQFPYHAGIYVPSTMKRASGALISTKHVLTVASFVKGIKFKLILGAYVFLNKKEPNRREFDISPKDVKIHPEYEEGSNDKNAAVIVIPKSFELNPYIQPIGLPDKKDASNLFEGLSVTITGFGLRFDEYSNTLTYFNTTVFALDWCSSYDVKPLDSTKLCTDTSEGQMICEGEDGAPVVLERNGKPIVIAIGLVQEDCDIGKPNIHLRTSSILHWLNYYTG